MTKLLSVILIMAAVYRLGKYARWAGQQGNLRGAVGLYIIAALVVAMPAGVYILNTLYR